MRIIAFIIFTSFLLSCGNSTPRQKKYAADPERVYVCSGYHSKRYHSVDDCKGLSKCSGDIMEMTIEEAEIDGKTPCKMCVKQP